MKKTLTICLLLAAMATGGAQAQGLGMDAILRQISANNGVLQANEQNTAAQKLANKAENNLADPTVSYAHLWDSADRNSTVGEMVVAQSFDFPTLYATRSRQNRARNRALDATAIAQRQELLLQAKELCLDIVMLHQQQMLTEERLHNAEELAKLYEQRLASGDANRIETNKINLELLNVRTQASLGRAALNTKLNELLTLNNGKPLTPGRPQPGAELPTPQALGLTQYALTPLPADFHQVSQELLIADASLQALEQESFAAARGVSASRQGWLPSLEVGYRRNTETGHPLNGIVVGGSLPIFSNRGKVKAARAKQQSTELLKENATIAAKSTLWQLYDEASRLQASMQAYDAALADGQNLDLLKQALTGGEISMIEYFVELAVIYDSRQNLIQLQNQYEKALARIYKSRL